MNILIVTDFFPNFERPHEGLFVWEQVKELKQRHSVVVIVPRYWYPPLKRYGAFRISLANIPPAEKQNGVRILRPVYRQVPILGEYVYPYWFFLKVLFFLSIYAVKFDLIHAHWAYRSGWWAVLLGRLLRKPIVFTTQGSDINYWMNESIKKGRIRWALSHASGIIFVSQKLANKIKSVGIRLKKSIVIANGIPAERYPKSIQQTLSTFSEKQILFIGNLFPVKGADRLLDALSLLKRRSTNWRASLIGDGPEKQKLKRKTSSLGLNKNVVFLGRLSNPEAMAKLETADVLVIPSRNEGSPLVLIEALALGKTVVAFNVGNVADVLNRPELGYVVREETPEALAEAILQALRSPVDAKLARKRAEYFLLKITVPQIEEFYQKVLFE